MKTLLALSLFLTMGSLYAVPDTNRQDETTMEAEEDLSLQSTDAMEGSPEVIEEEEAYQEEVTPDVPPGLDPTFDADTEEEEVIEE